MIIFLKGRRNGLATLAKAAQGFDGKEAVPWVLREDPIDARLLRLKQRRDPDGIEADKAAAIPIARARRAGDPTDAQLRSGNYKKRRITFAGLPIAIETEAGQCRHGVNRDGHAWEKRLPYAYGYFEGTLGVDGDAVDCFLGPDESAPIAYVVRQRKVNRWDQYDEDKVMLGFASESEAARCFLLGYNDDRFLGEVVPIAMDALPDRLKACRGKPLTAGGPAILLWGKP